MTKRRFFLPRLIAALVLILFFSLALAPPAFVQVRLPRVFAWESLLKGQDQETLRWPVAVAAGPDGELAVADAYRMKLFFFKDSGIAWAQSAAIDLEAAPLDMARDGDRYVVSLRGEPLLIALDTENKQLRHLPLPEGVIPGSLAPIPGGGVLVQDLATGDLLSISSRGSVRVLSRGLAMDIGDLAATVGGGMVATFPAAGEVRRFDAAGIEKGRWPVPALAPVPAWPVGISIAPSGDITVVDGHGQRLVSLDGSGRPKGIGSRGGWTSGLLRHPTRLTRLADGRMAVVDQGNGRIQIFAEVGTDSAP